MVYFIDRLVILSTQISCVDVGQVVGSYYYGKVVKEIRLILVFWFFKNTYFTNNFIFHVSAFFSI